MNQMLQNELVAPVKVRLGDAEYRLAFPISAVIAYKQKTGDSLYNLEHWKKLNPKEDPERFLTCLWAALRSHHPELTIERLGELVDFANLRDVEQSIVAALKSYFPEPVPAEDSQTPNPEPAEIPA